MRKLNAYFLIYTPHSTFSETQKRKLMQVLSRSNTKKRKKGLLYLSQDGYCNLCLKRFEIERMTFDHVIPKCLGGTKMKNNLQLLCSPCNRFKGAKSMKQVTEHFEEHHSRKTRATKIRKGGASTPKEINGSL